MAEILAPARNRAIIDDPVALQVVWTRLIAIADEAAATLRRTSFSPIVRESNDFACVIFDAAGNAIAENTIGIPSFNMTLSRTLQHFLSIRPAAEWRAGDVGICNDPWLTSGHLPDITIVAPVFADGRLIAWTGSIAHMADIGGTLWSADTKEVFEEGIRIPPLLYLREGKPNEDLQTMIRANVRLPDPVLGDIAAMIAAGEAAARGLRDLIQREGISDLAPISAEICARTERAMRKAIAAIPDGTYRERARPRRHRRGARAHRGHRDEARRGDLHRLHRHLARGRPRPQRGHELHRGLFLLSRQMRDRSGDAAQRGDLPDDPRDGAGGVDPQSALSGAGACAPARRPHAWRRRSTRRWRRCWESGSSRNPAARPPCACWSRAIARTAGATPRSSSSTAAWARAPKQDGLSATCFPSNVVCGSMEIIEALSPLAHLAQGARLRFRRPRPTSAAGSARTWRSNSPASRAGTLSLLVERVRHPAARRARRRRPGAASRVVWNGRDSGFPLKGKSPIAAGDRLRVRYPGGGGFGDPRKRDRAAVARRSRGRPHLRDAPRARSTAYDALSRRRRRRRHLHRHCPL